MHDVGMYDVEFMFIVQEFGAEVVSTYIYEGTYIIKVPPCGIGLTTLHCKL